MTEMDAQMAQTWIKTLGFVKGGDMGVLKI